VTVRARAFVEQKSSSDWVVALDCQVDENAIITVKRYPGLQKESQDIVPRIGRNIGEPVVNDVFEQIATNLKPCLDRSPETLDVASRYEPLSNFAEVGAAGDQLSSAAYVPVQNGSPKSGLHQ